MRRQAFAVLALAPVLALGLAGCGEDGGGSRGTGDTASDQEKMHEFAQCMRENGVDMPDPEDGKVVVRGSVRPGKGGADGADGEVEAAQKKCRHLMPNGGKPKKMKPEDVAKVRAYAKCMRDNGISEFPDPDSEGRIKMKAGPAGGMDQAGKEFQDAQKACQKLGPGGGGPFLGSRVDE